MREAVGGVVELVRPEPALLLREALRDTIVISGIAVRLFRHREDFSAKRAKQA